jgi:secondary thiamine-phosphate synthase enzyme
VRYKHNDIDLRPDSAEEAQRCRDNGWDIDNETELQRWREQEPINAHSHLLSMLVGSSESIPVVDGSMVIGQWQSVLLVDLDGPRDRTVGVQFLGYQ